MIVPWGICCWPRCWLWGALPAFLQGQSRATDRQTVAMAAHLHDSAKASDQLYRACAHDPVEVAAGSRRERLTCVPGCIPTALLRQHLVVLRSAVAARVEDLHRVAGRVGRCPPGRLVRTFAPPPEALTNAAKCRVALLPAGWLRVRIAECFVRDHGGFDQRLRDATGQQP